MISRFDILTIFPHFFDSYLSESLVEKALARKILEVKVHDLRAWSRDKHKIVDDLPYGGGPGMVFRPEPLVESIKEIKAKHKKGKVIYLSCQGSLFNQKKAKSLLEECEEILLVCGRYEGIDQRVLEMDYPQQPIGVEGEAPTALPVEGVKRAPLIDEEISVGDYILAGGEVPALVVMDALIRLIPGVIGKAESLKEESIEWGLLEYPHYTRPESFEGKKVPSVLLSGNHAEIRRWRLQKAIETTLQRRPDLLENNEFSEEIQQEIQRIKKF